MAPVSRSPIRSPEEQARLKEAARTAREDGETMHEIARALSVPASTLYRWAAEGGWRGKDLAAERFRAAMDVSSPPSQSFPDESRGPEDEALATIGTGSRRAPGKLEEKESEDSEPDIHTAPSITLAAEQALSASVRLMRSGRVSEAVAAARLAERYFHIARLQSEIAALMPEPDEEEEWSEEEVDALRAEVEQKIAHFIEARHGIPAYEPGEEPEGWVSRLKQGN